MEDSVNSCTRTFYNSIEATQKHNRVKRLQSPYFCSQLLQDNVVELSFFEKRDKKVPGSGWFGSSASASAPSKESSGKVKSGCWEKWSIKVNVHSAENDQQQRQYRAMAEKQLRACLFYIASIGASEIDHVPALTDPNAMFSFKVCRLQLLLSFLIYFV